jgi:hypothetical protein
MSLPYQSAFQAALLTGDHESACLALYLGSLELMRARVNHAAIEGLYDYAPVK